MGGVRISLSASTTVVDVNIKVQKSSTVVITVHRFVEDQVSRSCLSVSQIKISMLNIIHQMASRSWGGQMSTISKMNVVFEITPLTIDSWSSTLRTGSSALGPGNLPKWWSRADWNLCALWKHLQLYRGGAHQSHCPENYHIYSALHGEVKCFLYSPQF